SSFLISLATAAVAVVPWFSPPIATAVGATFLFSFAASRSSQPNIRDLLESVLDDRILRGAHLVQTSNGAMVGGVLEDVDVVRGLARDREHGVAERVERLLRLGLRRLDH